VASAPPDQPPESVILGAFKGLKNTVARERLGPDELERAVNVDLDDVGQARRRRGYVRKQTGSWHSVRTFTLKVLGVRDGTLVIINPNYSYVSLGVFVGPGKLAYTEVNGDIYFCNHAASGVVKADDTVGPWGQTNGQGLWLSPVIDETSTLGPVAGELLGDPIRANCIEGYKGRIYLADGKILWATELYRYHLVNRTRGFMQFEHDITLVMAVDDGLYVGTEGGLYFIKGTFGAFALSIINGDAVLPGSGQVVPTELIHPQARNGPVPAGTAVVFMTSGGIVAGFDGGTAYNLTIDAMVFPGGVSAAALFRQDSGANHYVTAIDSAGGPSANARIGDYCEAEIVRRI
jgi:hypothetical protein